MVAWPEGKGGSLLGCHIVHVLACRRGGLVGWLAGRQDRWMVGRMDGDRNERTKGRVCTQNGGWRQNARIKLNVSIYLYLYIYNYLFIYE